jgi:TrmH family RNA methyltransferase
LFGEILSFLTCKEALQLAYTSHTIWKQCSLVNSVKSPRTPVREKFLNFSSIKDLLKNRLIIALDTIQDPGNLGTIIRIADWYGIKDILCSESTAD